MSGRKAFAMAALQESPADLQEALQEVVWTLDDAAMEQLHHAYLHDHAEFGRILANCVGKEFRRIAES